MKFKVRGSGSSGAGWIGKHFFQKDEIYETDSPEMIALLVNSGLAVEIKPVEIEKDSDEINDLTFLDDKNWDELKVICDNLDIKPTRSKVDMINAIKQKMGQNIDE